MGRLSVRGVDDEVLRQFKDYVVRRYGKLHTVLGLEVSNALREYLERRAGGQGRGAHTHARAPPEEGLSAVKEEVLRVADPGGSLPRRMLEGIVRRACGVLDRRAVAARIGALEAEGFVKWDPVRGVFRVVGDG